MTSPLSVRPFAYVAPLYVEVRQLGGIMTVTDCPGEVSRVPLYLQEALDAAVAAERERCATLQQVWEDTRTQRDELLAHIAGQAPLPQWAADWLRA